MKTLAFIGILVFGAAAYGQDCSKGNCQAPMVKEVVKLPFRVVGAVLPNCQAGSCSTGCVEQVVVSAETQSPCQQAAKVRNCGFFAKLRSRVKCCR